MEGLHGDYLPPLVTQLKGDISDLRRTFVEGEVLAKEFVKDQDRTITEGMRNTGTAAGKAFRTEADKGLDGFTRDAQGRLRDARGRFVKDGTELARSMVDGMEREVDRQAPRLGGAGGRAGDSMGRGIRDSLKKQAPKEAQDFFDLFSSTVSELFSIGGIGFNVIVAGMIPVLVPTLAAALSSALGLGIFGAFTSLGIARLIKQPTGTVPRRGAKIGDTSTTMPTPPVDDLTLRRWTQLTKHLENALDVALKGGFKTGLLAGMREFDKHMPEIKAGLKAVFDAIGPLLKPLGDALGKSAGIFLKGMGDTLKNATPAIQAFIEQIPAMTQAFTDFIVKLTANPNTVVFIKNTTADLIGLINVLGDVVNWLDDAYGWMDKFFKKIYSVGGASNPLTIQFHLWGAALQDFMGVGSTVLDWWSRGLTEAGKKIIDFVGKIWGLGKSAKDALLGVVKDAGHWLVDAGHNVMTGFIFGIKNAVGDVVSAVKDAMKAAIQGAKDILLHRSPSRVFMAMGNDSMTGYILGVRSRTDDVHHAVGVALKPSHAVQHHAVHESMTVGRGHVSGGLSHGGGRNYVPIVINLGGVELARFHAALIETSQRYGSRTATTGVGTVAIRG